MLANKIPNFSPLLAAMGNLGSEYDSFTIQGDGSVSINSKYFDEDFKDMIDIESEINPRGTMNF